MAKYTDEQIKKALDGADVFLRNRANAKPAPLNKYDKEALLDIAKICDEAVDLINRQEAEIERYRKEHKENFDKWDRLAERTKQHYEELYQEAKAIVRAEAIKEFAEKVVERIEKARQKYQRLCIEQGEKEDEVMNIHFIGIINIVRKMVGEN